MTLAFNSIANTVCHRYSREQLLSGFASLCSLLPGFTPSPEALPAAQWAALVADVPGVGARLVALKVGGGVCVGGGPALHEILCTVSIW